MLEIQFILVYNQLCLQFILGSLHKDCFCVVIHTLCYITWVLIKFATIELQVIFYVTADDNKRNIARANEISVTFFKLHSITPYG